MANELPLQPWELLSVQASFENTLMRTTAQWQRPVSERTKGGQSRTYVALGNIEVTLESAPSLSKEITSGDAQRAEGWWEITTAATLTVQATDRFIIDGSVFEPTEGDGNPTNPFTNIIRCRRLMSFVTPILLPNAVSANATVRSATIS